LPPRCRFFTEIERASERAKQISGDCSTAHGKALELMSGLTTRCVIVLPHTIWRISKTQRRPRWSLDIDSRVTFAHHRELVKPSDARKYWNIIPATADVVQFAASA
jgi:hypothetical protein